MNDKWKELKKKQKEFADKSGFSEKSAPAKLAEAFSGKAPERNNVWNRLKKKLGK